MPAEKWTRKNVQERVLVELISYLPPGTEGIPIDSDFVSDLGLDSIMLQEFATTLEERFHLPKMSDEDLARIRTPLAAIDYIAKQVIPGEAEMQRARSYKALLG